MELTGNLKELQEKLETQQVQLGLIIPQDFATKIKKKVPVEVQVIADGRQTNSAALASGYVQQIVAGYSEAAVPVASAGVNVITRNWYNSNLDYKLYLMSNLVATMALIVTLLLTSLSVVREKENGTFVQLLTYANPLRFFLAATKDLFFKGISLANLGANIGPLLLIAVITLSLAGWTFTRQLE